MAKTSKLIERTLLAEYGLPKDEAVRIEEELFIWFGRLSRRPGTPQSTESLRHHLISMTCKVGHVYWFGKLGEVRPSDERVKRSIALGPEIVAIELEKEAKDAEVETNNER